MYPKRRKRRTRHRAEIAPRSVKQDLTCQMEGHTIPVSAKPLGNITCDPPSGRMMMLLESVHTSHTVGV